MAMMTAHIRCNLHEARAALYGPPPSRCSGGKREQGLVRSNSVALGYKTQEPTICTRSMFASVALMKRMDGRDFTAQAENYPNPTKSSTTHTPLRTLRTSSSDQLHREGQMCPTRSNQPREAKRAPFSAKLQGTHRRPTSNIDRDMHFDRDSSNVLPLGNEASLGSASASSRPHAWHNKAPRFLGEGQCHSKRRSKARTKHH